jgi:hypothetical protein
MTLEITEEQRQQNAGILTAYVRNMQTAFNERVGLLSTAQNYPIRLVISCGIHAMPHTTGNPITKTRTLTNFRASRDSSTINPERCQCPILHRPVDFPNADESAHCLKPYRVWS